MRGVVNFDSLSRPRARVNVVIDVVAILYDRRPLALSQFHILDPVLGSVGDRQASALRCVNALAHVDLYRCLKFVRMLLAIKGLYVPLTLLVNVINNPTLFLFAISSRPFPLAH